MVIHGVPLCFKYMTGRGSSVVRWSRRSSAKTAQIGEDCTEMIGIGFIIVSSVVGFADSGRGSKIRRPHLAATSDKGFPETTRPTLLICRRPRTDDGSPEVSHSATVPFGKGYLHPLLVVLTGRSAQAMLTKLLEGNSWLRPSRKNGQHDVLHCGCQ